MKTPLLKQEEINAAIKAISGWELNSKAEITRTFEFKDFSHALLFVNSVGYFSEKMDHHPDIDIRWNTVTLALSTHEAGGLTERDFVLARQFDRLTQPSPCN